MRKIVTTRHFHFSLIFRLFIKHFTLFFSVIALVGFYAIILTIYFGFIVHRVIALPHKMYMCNTKLNFWCVYREITN